MVEPKTLKDIVTFGVDYSSESGKKSLTLVSDCDLREEAINWVKELRRFDDIYCCSCDDDCGSEMEDNNGTQDWIKHFFNITEEDLE